MENQNDNPYYTLTKRLIQVEKKTEAETAAILVGEGLDRENAEKMASYASGSANANGIAEEEEGGETSGSGVKDIVIGGLFCVGGVIATMADIGYIFWGAIVFGGVQMIRGFIKVAS